jgi:ABC-type multidrug transport system permease subunit
MKFELKSIGYWSVIKISFVINLVVGACIGLFVGTFFGLIMSFASQMGGMGGMSGMDIPMFENGGPASILVVIMMVFLYGFMGAIFNTILAIIITFVYNMASRLLGGVELELSQMQLQPVMPNAYAGQQGAQYQQQPMQAYAQPQPQMPQQAPPPPPVQPQAPQHTPPPPPPPVQPLPPDITPPEGGTDRDNPPA